jgi:hypothetical protein
MSTYKVFCHEGCEAEYTVTPFEGDTNTVPVHCSYCGIELIDECIGLSDDDFNDEEWNKLSEESLEDWKYEDDDTK